MMGVPQEEQRTTCRHCGRVVIWYFDRDDDAKVTPFGWWYDAERMTEVCPGVDGEHDDDLWHEPAECARCGRVLDDPNRRHLHWKPWPHRGFASALCVPT